MQRFGLAGNVWLRTLYEDRERWAPVYSKDTFFAGVSVSQRGFFEGYIHRQTSLQEFLDEIYESALQKMHQKEALDDSESRSSTLPLRTSSQYELQEVPIQYVLARWRKDLKRIYVAEIGAGNVDIANPVQRFDHLYKRAMQVVGEGMVSGDRYRVAWEAFKESLNKIKRV
ncbi:Protein FAR1-RELATED SEQUENCE 8 [Linum perenne]